MIHIFKGDNELGFALFDEDTGKFEYGELCHLERLKTFVNSYPEHPVVIFAERDWLEEELQQIYFLIPHLQHWAKVKTMKKVSVKQMLVKSAKDKKKKNPVFLYLFAGVILGCFLLMPTSSEYKNSVLVKAQSTKETMEEFVQKQPNMQSRQQLYTSLVNLYQKVRVEAVTYTDGSFKVIFSATSQDLKITDFPEFKKATLKKVSSLENGKDANIHIYELEGSL
ncbi:hypothetical protein [Lysinibacillus xylanilyticus]|uniref:hypothetical protein n=1 Tax=Lysinibacillus xylanilyticus TaxID=582475 RepID=UPI0036DA51D0